VPHRSFGRDGTSLLLAGAAGIFAALCPWASRIGAWPMLVCVVSNVDVLIGAQAVTAARYH
jgi:uncharacterized membrane protein